MVDSVGYAIFSVSGNGVSFDNGNSNATSGSSYLVPGTYTLQVIANDNWTISF